MTKSKEKRIKIIYSRLQHLISQIPLEKDKPAIEDSTVQQYHSIVEETSDITGEDYSSFKVSEDERENWASELLNEPPKYYWKTTPVRAKIMDLIGQLRVEYDTERDDVTIKSLLREQSLSFWDKYRDKLVFWVVVVIVLSLLYLVFKIDLFHLIGIDFGL